MSDRRLFLRGLFVGTIAGALITLASGFIALRIAENRLLTRSQARLAQLEAERRSAFPVPRFTSTTSLGRAPLDWQLLTLNGEEIPFSGFQGRAVLLNFWGSWCGPCRAELPFLEGLRSAIPEADLAIILVSDEEVKPLQAFLAKKATKLPIYRGSRTRPRELQPPMLPTSLLLSSDGRILLHHVGAAKWNDSTFVEELRSRLQTTVEPRPSLQ